MSDNKAVSLCVQNDIKKFKGLEGNKKAIDTKNEYDQLAEYLSGNKASNGFTFGVKEKEYIEGFMIEYENKEKAEAKKKFEEEAVTPDTKENIKKIAKRTGNKKEIDTDDEAQSLLAMIRNTKGELNEADLKYIRQVLVASGYGTLLTDGYGADAQEANKKEIEDKTVEEKEVEENEEPVNPVPQKEEPVVSEATEKSGKESHEKEKSIPKEKPAQKIKPSPKPAPAPSPKPAPGPKELKKPELEERGKASGTALADRFLDKVKIIEKSYFVEKEAKDEVVKALKDVSEENAYSFFKHIEGRTQKQINSIVFNFGDFKDQISYKDTLYAMKQLLAQAKSFGLSQTKVYKALDANITYVQTRVNNNPQVDPDDKEKLNSDRAITNLLKVMGIAMKSGVEKAMKY